MLFAHQSKEARKTTALVSEPWSILTPIFAFEEKSLAIATCCVEQNCKHGGTLSVFHVSFLAESFAVGGVVFRRFLFSAISESSWRQPASQGPDVMETRT